MDYKLCSRATFDLLTDYAVRRKVNAQTWGGTQGMSDAVRIFGQAYVRCHHFPEAIATVLYEANVASLATKIGQSNANDHRFTGGYQYRPVAIDIDPRLVLRQIRRVREESYSVMKWDETLAFEILNAIERSAVDELSEGQIWLLHEKHVRPPMTDAEKAEELSRDAILVAQARETADGYAQGYGDV
jgi:hypothetical protein